MFFASHKKKKFACLLTLGSLLSQIFAPTGFAFLDFLSEKNTEFVPDVQNTRLVSIFVEDRLLEDKELEDKIHRYIRDVQQAVEGKAVLIPLPRDASPLDIAEGNAHLYFSGLEGDGRSQLVGTIFIGDVPIPIVEKNNNLWPTIYPYVDFENSSYQWDIGKNRFIYEGGGDENPEIWHGLIRSDYGEGFGISEADLWEDQKEQLSDYFDSNHQVHTGETSFGKRVFFLDLPYQKEGMNDQMREYYGNYISHLEDILYLRFHKHWLADLLSDSGMNDSIPLDIMPEDVAPSSLPDLSEDAVKMPDVQTKMLIEKFVQRYFEAYKPYLSRLHSMIENAQRWDSGEVDTTISLVSRKDEAAGLFLKSFNDALESTLNTQLQNKNIATDISVPDTTDLIFAETVGQPEGKPLYWNGVQRSGIDVRDCSLLRGSPRSTDDPMAQMVEANRAYHLETAQSGFSDPLCIHHSKSQEERDADPYAGCCALNLETDEDLEYTINGCVTTSTWIDETTHRGAELPVFDRAGTTEKISGSRGASGCSSIIDSTNEDPARAQRFDSLMLHQEPTAETIAAQVEALSSFSMPVDDPRGVSFYDHGKTFREQDYFDIFDLRDFHVDLSDSARRELLRQEILSRLQQNIQTLNTLTENGNTTSSARLAADQPLTWPGTQCEPPAGYGCSNGSGVPIDESNCREYTKTVTEPDSFTTRIDWTEECTWTQWGMAGEPPLPILLDTTTENETIVRFYETGTTIDEDVLTKIATGFDLEKVIDNLLWIDKPIQEKNRIVFEKAFGDISTAREFFFDTSFQGYELVEIIGHDAESKTVDTSGFEMIFEQGEPPAEDEWVQTKRSADQFSPEKKNTQSFLGKAFEETFLGASALDNECGDISNFREKILCYAEKTTAQSEESIRVLSSEEGSDPIVVSPFEPPRALDELSQITLQPTEILISSQEVDPVMVTATLRNKAGQVLVSDFDSSVELLSESSDIEKFFDIQPSDSVSPTAGKASFYLVPRSSSVGGKLSLQARVGEIISEPLPVTVSRYALYGFAKKNTISAGAEEGVEIALHLRDEEENRVIPEQSIRLFCRSSWGQCGEGNEMELIDGTAHIRFFPGIRSGKADITIGDEAGNIAPLQIELEITPAQPTQLLFEQDSSFLLPGSDFLPISVFLADQYDNQIPNIPFEVIWEGEHIEFKKENPTSSSDEGVATVFLRPAEEASEVSVRASGSVQQNEEENTIIAEKTFSIVREGVLRTEISDTELIAGSDDIITVLLRAETSEGERIAGNFEVGIINIPGGIGLAPPTVLLQDGLGKFEITAGTRAGKAEFQLVAPGFRAEPFSIDILPSEAEKVFFSVDQKTLNLDSNDYAQLEVSIVDQYGNIVFDFSEKVTLLMNQPDILQNEEIEMLREMGVIGEVGEEQWYLQNQAQTQRAQTSSSPDISIKDGQALQFVEEGQKTIKIEPGSTASDIYMTSETESLTPDATSLSVTQYLTVNDIRALKPHSLLTLLLGFDSGNLEDGQNEGNAWLFTGNSQAVGTLIVPPLPSKRHGFLSAGGEISSTMTAQLRFDRFPRFEIFTSDEQVLADVRMRFLSTPDFQITSEQNIETPGIYFIPVEKDIDFYIRDGILMQDQEKLFLVSESGGFFPYTGDITFTNIEGSILRWEVQQKDQTLGTLVIIPDQERVKVLSSFDAFSERTDSGFFLTKLWTEAHVQYGLTGHTSNDPKGVFFVDPDDTESLDRRLGSAQSSVEDVDTREEDIVWTEGWKPASFLAAGNSIGRSTQWDSSDAFVLLGDPTLPLASENPRSGLGLTDDIGTQLWKSSEGVLEKILTTDINGDGEEDILNLVGQKLFALYQDDSQTDNFRDIGAILRFSDGAEALIAFDNDRDGFGDLLQLNAEYQEVLHKNTYGTYTREDIDLRMEKKIIEIQSAHLNTDVYTDLVVLDEDNCLHKILGVQDGFGIPEEIYCFSPTFEPLSESYSPAENQDEVSRYFDAEKYSFLPEVLISADNIVTKNIDDRFLEEKCSAENADHSFIAASKNTQANVLFHMESDEGKLIPGSILDIRLEVTPTEELTNFEAVLPPFAGLHFREGTLTCDDCENSPRESQATCEGDILITGGVNLPAEQKSIFRWELEVGELPEVEYFVDDYFDGDDLDDILIPWKDGDDEYLVQMSGGGEAPHQPQFISLSETDIPELDDFTGDMSGSDLANSLLSPLKSDSDGDGYPDMYESPATEDDMSGGLAALAVMIQSAQCGGCGLPIISKTFLAPGADTIYSPPIAIPGGFDLGFPVLAFPTTLYTPAGVPIPFLWPGSPLGKQYPEGPFFSFFRMYVMPTTTGQVGLGMCLGPFASAIVPPVFLPNCFVMVPSVLGALGMCPAPSNSGVNGMNLGSNNSASFVPKVDFEITNQQIQSADIVTTWLNKQYQALQQIKMPTVSVQLPDFSSDESSADSSEKDAFEAISGSPFVNVKREKVTISYPFIGAETLEKIKKDYQDWRQRLNTWKKESIQTIENYEGSIAIRQGALDFVADAEDMAQRVEKNINTIESYQKSVESLKALPTKVSRAVSSLQKNTEVMSDYVSNWAESTEKALEDWSRFRVQYAMMLESWESIPQIFQGFTQNCPSCSVDRGTMHEWLLRIFLSGVDFPVLQPPKLPDINLDFSGLTFGNEVIIPDLTFEPVELDIFSIPNIPAPLDLPPADASARGPDVGIRFGPLPQIPLLPPMQMMDIDIQLPTLSLPPLPTIPGPPSVPNILAPIEVAVQIPKAFLNLTCLLVMGIAPVPEWHLKAYVSQLTNRTTLFDLDFSVGALSPATPSISSPGAEDINVTVEQNFQSTLKAFQKVKDLERISRETLQNISNTQKKPVMKSSQEITPLVYSRPKTKTVAIDFEKRFANASLTDEEKELFDRQKKSFQALADHVKDLDSFTASEALIARDILASLQPSRPSFVSSILSAALPRWLTSTIDVGAIPTDLPEDFDLDAFEASQEKTQEEPGIYYVDAANNVVEKVTEFPMSGVYAYWFADLNNDDEEEILYSFDDELYLKYRVPRELNADELEENYEDRYDEEYEDRFTHFYEWEYEEFIQKYRPAKNWEARTQIEGFSAEFERMWEDVWYFEWIVSERPDAVFEFEEDAKDRISALWHRHAFLIRPPVKHYEIRPMSTRVTKIEGSPVLYASPSEPIEKLPQSDCDDPKAEKPFFATESILVGLKNNSRMEVRVPPREGQQEEYREIVLHEGEETMVEYAEVCLTRGEVEHIATDEVQKIKPRRNLYLPPGARFELGNNDRVTLDLFDGTEVLISGNETYEIQYFESSQQLIDTLQDLPVGNHYGFFQAFRPDGKSYFIPKFLHDPQGADDTNPPEISVVGGTEVEANLFQPISIDASQTTDAQPLAKVWWDLHPDKDSDGDGDPLNDEDFSPEVETPRDLLKVQLPAYESEGSFGVVLNVEDESGNVATQEIQLKVSPPQISLLEASVRSGKVIGRIENGIKDMPVYILRTRTGQSEVSLRSEPILTQEEGNFSLEDMSTESGLEILDSEDKVVAEILPTGRPVIEDENIGFEVQAATTQHPFRIRLRDASNQTLGYISFVSQPVKVQILEKNDTPPEEGIFVRDLNAEDAYSFYPLSFGDPLNEEGVALVDTDLDQTLGVLDPRGDFQVLGNSDLRFTIRRAISEDDPVVFEIRVKDEVIGEFGIRFPEGQKPKVEIE
ncbi:hypothetical protein K9M59_03865 [Candidatus Gracilibacteria bacterium]|nr:hypothetical protein [Candidatus Gracilibacteria bacterium]MCF7819460.1 hypothetical protein [Candidatus Gracilibacteria bacterium]